MYVLKKVTEFMTESMLTKDNVTITIDTKLTHVQDHRGKI